MSQTGLPAFDSTLQTTNLWLNDLMGRMGWIDRQRAYHALRAVLYVLRDHLPVDQVAALGAQLPLLVRGFCYEGWHPHGKPLKERKQEEFLARVAAGYPQGSDANPERITRAVLAVLAQHVTAGEIDTVKQLLPAAIRALWP
jgi:uncharacterized protein (DUF2267 family)